MNRTSRAVLLGGLASVLLLLPYLRYVTDDTYIHMQFARNLLAGSGFAFNAGEPTYGFTSPLWVLSLAGLGKLQIDLLWASKILGFLSVLGGVWATARLARELIPDPWAQWAAVGAWAVNVWSLRWGISGMETPLAVFLVTLGIAEHLRTRREGTLPWSSSALFALATLVRPEVLGLICLAGVDHLLHAWKPVEMEWVSPASRDRAARRARSGSRRFQPVLVFVLVTFSVLGPWAFYSLGTFGQFFPNTAYAKAGTFELAPAEIVRLLVREAKILGASNAFEGVLVLVAAFLVLGGATRTPRTVWLRRYFLPLAWLVALPALYAVRGSVLVSRYLLPVVPVLVCFGFAGLGLLMTRTRRPVLLRKRAPFVLLAFIVVQNLAVNFVVAWPSAMSFTRGMQECLIPIGEWLRDNTDPSDTVAVPDIGALGYVSQRRIIDLSGLVTPEMILAQEGQTLDEFVSDLGFSLVARPDYLVDRYTAPDRFAEIPKFDQALEMLFHRKMGPLGIARADDYYYTVYAIDWTHFRGKD